MSEDTSVGTFFWEEFKKWATRGLFVILTAIIISLWTPYASNLKSIWDAPSRLDAIEVGISDINENLRSLNGEDRIIRQQEGLSYVEEPVTQGENIFLYLVVERTEFGKDCILTKAVPLFKDKTGVTTPGTRPERTLHSGVTDKPQPFRFEYIPPPHLEPGRVEVYVSLEYNCDGRQRFDRTSVLSYKLLRKD